MRRPYFHFKELDPSEIANWNEYLTIVENEGDVEATARLYERALIPGALCSSLWLRFANFAAQSNNSEILKRYYNQKQIYAIQSENDPFYHFSAFVSSPTTHFGLVLFERANTTALGISPEFQHKLALFFETNEVYDTANDVFERLSQNRSAEAGLAIAWHQIREGARVSDLEGGVFEAVKTISEFMSKGLNADEYVILSALFYSLNQRADVDRLKSFCNEYPLALGLSLKVREKDGPATMIELYRNFLLDKKSKMSVQNKLRLLPRYINFLRCYGTITEIREAQKYMMDLERKRREEILEGRKESIKNSQNLNEIQDRWVLFLQECDEIAQGYQNE